MVGGTDDGCSMVGFVLPPSVKCFRVGRYVNAKCVEVLYSLVEWGREGRPRVGGCVWPWWLWGGLSVGVVGTEPCSYASVERVPFAKDDEAAVSFGVCVLWSLPAEVFNGDVGDECGEFGV